MIRDTILFDLDGTLLPLDADKFMNIYFGEMGRSFQDMIDPKLLVQHVWSGTKAMISSSENITNENVFMDTFAKLIDGDLNVYQERFDRFYDEGFLKVRESVEASPIIKETIALLKDKGYTLAIATNPLFPKKAILHRIEWAGLNVDDFEYVSHYEKNCFCKPNIQFYLEVLEALGKKPNQCYMVGNDVQEDMIAAQLGIETYLITDYIINREDEITCNHMGSYQDFHSFAVSLPTL